MATIKCKECDSIIQVEYNPVEKTKNNLNKEIIDVKYLPYGKCNKSIYLKCDNGHDIKAYVEIRKIYY
jgi:hypothetical protein